MDGPGLGAIHLLGAVTSLFSCKDAAAALKTSLSLEAQFWGMTPGLGQNGQKEWSYDVI